MFKKSISCLMILASLCVLHTSAKENLSEQIVSVPVFDKLYYGTLTSSAQDEQMIFTSLSNSEDAPESICGTWKKDSFSGACTISYPDGRTLSVKYNKNGVISGDVTEQNTDGSFFKYSCSSGKPNQQISLYSADSKKLGKDWFYLCTPMSEWKEAALSVSYQELTETPYEYIDLPIALEGTITEIYETAKQSYVKLADAEDHIYLIKYNNETNNRFSGANIKNVSVGEKLTVYGIYTGFSDVPRRSIKLYNHIKGYQLNTEQLQEGIVSEDFLEKYDELFSSSNEELSSIPQFTGILAESKNDVVDPMHLTNDYSEICDFPFYYMDKKISLTGTVVYETFDPESHALTLLISEKESGNLYCISSSTEECHSYLDKTITCSGTLYGNAKLPYCLKDHMSMGYALFPNIKLAKLKTN